MESDDVTTPETTRERRPPKNNSVGVLLCGCGPNIAEAVDLTALAAEISEWDDVEWVAKRNLTCSEDEHREVVRLLQEWPVERVVVAGCSPKEREETFRGYLAEAGMNPFLLQLTNIREHCAWMETDRTAATEKAKTIIAAAVARVLLHVPIAPRKISVCRDVLVIGAGVAGMQAAVLMAREGRTVHLVDRAPSIGGLVPLLGELFPSMECSSCVLEPLMDEVLHRENIHVHLMTDVTDVRGFLGNFRVRFIEHPRGMDHKACFGCGCCVEACPVEVADEGFPSPVKREKKKAVAHAYQGALPNTPVVNWDACIRSEEEICRACETACPFGAVDLSRKEKEVHLEVGAVVVAAGAGGDKSRGNGKNVCGAREFERMVNPGGPTAGEITMPSGGKPDSVAVVALDDDYGDDELTAMNATKYVLTVLEKLPLTKVDLYKGRWSLSGAHNRARWEEIRKSDRVRVHSITSPEDFSIDSSAGTIVYGGSGTKETSTPQLVVVCSAQAAAEGMESLAGVLGLEVDERGFIKKERSILGPVSTGVRGIFVAGSAAGPVHVGDAITQGTAVAGRIASLLTTEAELELNPYTSFVDAGLCSACGTCVSVCAFGAVARKETGEIAVEEVLCLGCGVCSAACPSGAIQIRHFKSDQITSEVTAICRGRGKR